MGVTPAGGAALLHFSSPRDASAVAAFLRTPVYRPESLARLEEYRALVRSRKENPTSGLPAVAHDIDTEVGATQALPLRRWVHQQRRMPKAGKLDPHLKELLDTPRGQNGPGARRMAQEAKPAALRSYRRAAGHLAPHQDTVWSVQNGNRAEGPVPVPVGQHMANLPRKNGLGKNPERTVRRAAHLTTINPDRNCPRPLNPQRHHRISPPRPTPIAICPRSHPAYPSTPTTPTPEDSSRTPGTQAQLLPEQRKPPARLDIETTTSPSPTQPAPPERRHQAKPRRHSGTGRQPSPSRKNGK